jgi:hypothetical protein
MDWEKYVMVEKISEIQKFASKYKKKRKWNSKTKTPRTDIFHKHLIEALDEYPELRREAIKVIEEIRNKDI